MRNTLRAAAFALLLIGVPSIASAATAAEIQAQIQAMIAEVQKLQMELAGQTQVTPSTQVTTQTTTTSAGACPLIGRVLKRGSSGDDVARLQTFLARDPNIYPEAQVTGYYGALTEAAVKRWQTKYNIVSSGDADTTGFGVTGPRTAAAISLQCGGSSVSVGSGGVTPTVGGYVQVTPIIGTTPLTVQVIANVNTVNSCQGATYTLEWGDNTTPSTIPVAAGICTQSQQVFSHIYVTPGTYTIKLSAGGHSTTAMVQVMPKAQ